MKPVRVLLLVLGSLLAVVGFGLLAGGATLGWAAGTQRDDAGFFTTPSDRFTSDSFAVTSEKIDLGKPDRDEWWAERDIATVRITADSANSKPLFVGIGPEADIEAYLAGVPHDEITDVTYRPFSADYRRENTAGTTTPKPPADQTFWVANASGSTSQILTWDLEPGRWEIVVMNADGTRSVAADIEFGGKLDYLVPIAIGLGLGGVVAFALGVAMIIGGAVRPRSASNTTATLVGPTGSIQPALLGATTGRYPLRIEGHLDPNLSRWKWLVKWILAIPHFVILALLWVAFAVLSIVAFFAILFTGIYPRSIFEFNVGVLRWSWRVSFYATSAFGTDRYPPFTLDNVEYPATLDIAYPEHLSRGLVLVKSWLLALPHLIIVGIFTATLAIGSRTDGARFVLSGGLLGILVAIAAVVLLFTSRYPTGLFSLIMGINRWTYRVIAYVALMTDDYPPFRLDQGGSDPGSLLPPPNAAATPAPAEQRRHQTAGDRS